MKFLDLCKVYVRSGGGGGGCVSFRRYSDLFELNWDLMRRVKPLFDRHEIDIPFPQRVVHSAKEVE